MAWTRPVAKILGGWALFVAMPATAQVTPGDTFNLAIIGYNTNSPSTGIYIVQPLTVTFNGDGSSQMFTGSALGGQTVTVATTQTISGSNYTDSFTISVPTNFVPSGTTANGSIVDNLQLQFGGYAAGTNMLDFSQAVTNPTYSGSVGYGASQTLVLAPSGTLSNNATSLQGYEGLSGAGTDLSQFAIRQFTYSVSYASSAPEPAAWCLMILGFGIAGATLRRRKRASRWSPRIRVRPRQKAGARRNPTVPTGS